MRCITSGGKLAEISPEAMQKFNEFLPPQWSHNNPVDILGDASPERYAQALEVAAADEKSDGLVGGAHPPGYDRSHRHRQGSQNYAKSYDKPILASWSGGQDIAAGESILNRAGIPTFMYPDTAAEAFAYMWKYTDNLKALYETVSLPQDSATQAGP